MLDFNILRSNTPVVLASCQDDRIAFSLEHDRCLYYKNFDVIEFIGEKLASVRNLRSAHYVPLCLDDYSRVLNSNRDVLIRNVKVGSFDFKLPGVTYKFAEDLSYYRDNNSFDILLEHCNSDENRLAFINENLELLALDTYMGQIDRPQNNLYEFYPDGSIHLAPIFDYQYSLDYVFSESIRYDSDFHQFLTIDDYQEMILKYPQFGEYLRTYLGVDLEKQILSMADERGFDMGWFNMDPFKKFDEGAHKKLEKILK